LLSAGVSSNAADYVWQTTAEGDWILLMLLTARFLLKSLDKAMTGGKDGKSLPTGPVAYLAPLRDANFKLGNVAPPKAEKPETFFDLQYLKKLFEYSALSAVVGVGKFFQSKLASGLKFDDAWNAVALDLVGAVRSHCFNFLLSTFISAINECTVPEVKDVLSKLCALFACSNILDDPQWTGLFARGQLRLVKSAVVQLLDDLRPNAVAIVDAFDIPDRVLVSAIGRFDGNVYEALFAASQKSVMNKTDPFDGYKEHLQPRLDLEFLKKGNKLPDAAKL